MVEKFKLDHVGKEFSTAGGKRPVIIIKAKSFLSEPPLPSPSTP